MVNVRGVGVVITHHAFHQGALAGTVFSKQSVKGTGLEADRDVLQGRHWTEPFCHGVNGEVTRWRQHGSLARCTHRLMETSPGAPARRCLVDEL